MAQSTAYSNYHALQAAYLKTSRKLTYKLNFTWSKILGTGLQIDPFDIRHNYGAEFDDRPYVFNSSYTYQFGRFTHGNPLVCGAVGGRVVSGISTWQSGGNLQALNSPNFGLSLQYTGIPTQYSSTSAVTSGIGGNTYFGTDAGIAVRPVLTCDPRGSGYTRVKLGCFAAPAVGTQGGQAYPYMSMGAYFDNDIAVYKSFPVHERQNVQFRVSIFD
ncbi:MAG: hypothetical protein ACRYFU_21405 [Janthinobacterium lividum]